jgi:hypothetical protein
MNTKRTHEATLIDEIERYLAAVEFFRLLGHEPCWLPETVRQDPVPFAPSPKVSVSRRAD